MKAAPVMEKVDPTIDSDKSLKTEGAKVTNSEILPEVERRGWMCKCTVIHYGMK